jgi:hypothetical protein
MKNIFAAIILSALVLTSTAQKYDLKLNLKQGQHYLQSMVMDMDMTESVSGQEINISTKMQFDFKQEVKSITSAGDFVVESQYARIAMTVDGMGQKISYDSDNKDTSGSEIIKTYTKTFSSIIGKKFQVTMTPKGKVKEIKGLKEIIAAMKNGSDESTQRILEGTFDEKKLASNFESSYHIFPDNPVKVGETWTQQSSVESMFPIDIKTVYTLKEVKNGIAKIASSGDMNMKKDDFETNGMKMKIDFTGTYAGTYEMDVNTGMSKRGAVIMPMKGTMEMMGMEVPVTISTNLQTTTTATNE